MKRSVKDLNIPDSNNKRRRIKQTGKNGFEDDSIVKIVNSLSYDRSNNKFLNITDNNADVFQFPKKKIYIRDCYERIFRDIFNGLSRIMRSNVVITGQPGIGKSSFLYVLLFFLKENLTRKLSDDEKKAIEYYNKKIAHDDLTKIISINEAKIDEINSRLTEIEADVRNIEQENEKLNNNFGKYFNAVNFLLDYRIDISQTEKQIGDDLRRNLIAKIGEEEFERFIDEFLQELREDYSLRLFYPKVDEIIILLEPTLRNNEKRIMDKWNAYKEEIKTKTKEKEKEKYKVKERYIYAVLKTLYRAKNYVKVNLLSIDVNEKMKEEMLKEKENMNKMKEEMLKEKENMNNVAKLSQAEEEKLQKIDIKFRCSIPEYGKIFIFKNKKGGNYDSKRVYLFEKVAGTDGKYVYKLRRIENPGYIKGSIIIVDTYYEKFHESNRVISISAPDSENNKHYAKGEAVRLYFDSFDDGEIREWFNNCVNIPAHDFEEVHKIYGNIPRLIYYHYLYQVNYGKDYWDYYKDLIESVVGSTGYCRFKKYYMGEWNLEKEPLSNIILKYDMELKWNKILHRNILVPKDYLIFVSESVESYVTSKLFPAENDRDYKELEEYSKSVNDKYIKRMAMKQRVAYKLSTEVIKINGEDDEFEISDDIYVPACYPANGQQMVHYILKEDNYFDLIINGIFVKILTGDETFDRAVDKSKRAINESIIEYSKEKNGVFKYVVIKNETYDDRIFTVNIEGSTSVESNPIRTEVDVKTTSYHINNIYVDVNIYYIMRDFYYKVFNIILGVNFNDERQRNYLIFGTEGIGKTILALIINDYLKLLYPELKVILIYNDNSERKLNESENNDYVIISDERPIGEDEYPDAKVIILIGNAYDEKLKTFQSKRLPLIMYIPPFTKEEIVGVLYLMNPFIVKEIKQHNIISTTGIIFDSTIGEAYSKIFKNVENNWFKSQNSILRLGCPSGYNEELSSIVVHFIQFLNPGYEVLVINGLKDLNRIDVNKPHVIISDGIEIDGNNYPNAKMIIIINTPTDKSDQVTLETDDIIPFEKSESDIKEKINNCIFYNGCYFCYYNKEVKKEDYDKNIDDIILKDTIEKYENNYQYYGGIIGNYNTNKMDIKNIFKGMKKEELLKLFEDVMIGINISLLSKRDYNKLLIYTTYENDITKAGPLKFVSKEIEEIALNFLRKKI